MKNVAQMLPKSVFLRSRGEVVKNITIQNYYTFDWSGRGDLNSRPLGPEPSALPSCATPRPRRAMIELHFIP